MRTRLPCLLVLLAASAGLAAQDPPKTDDPPPMPTTETGITVYRQVLKSTVWVHSDRGGGRTATGSGSLIDKGRRLVLTNYHVVGTLPTATVYFPAYDGKKVISEKKYYTDRRTALGIRGDIVELDKEADLALIRLDRVPPGYNELPLAADSPEPGQTVHSLGNPGKSRALWVYTPGKVRQVFKDTWKARLDERTVATFRADVVTTDSPTNPGDSGGPLVNDAGKLVGVTQGGQLDANAINTFIDVSEVRRLMRRRSVVALRDTDPPPAKKESPARDKPVESKDAAKFFGEEAFKAARAAADKLFKEKKVDFVVETVETPPKGDAEKVRAMSPADREKVFKEYVQERVKAEKVSGVYLFVCKSPASLYVEVTEGFGGPDDDRKKLSEELRKTLLGTFRVQKFDDGLNQAVQMVLTAKGLGDKK